LKKPAAWSGTAVVVLHLLINLVHGAAHSKIQIPLSSAATVFVLVVIFVCPLLATALLWTRYQRLGLVLLGVAMACSLIFGLYHHFWMPGLDQVGQQGSDFWASAFALTAWLLAITEAAGAFIGFHFLIRKSSY
jgi:hypothetical protein